MASTPMFSVDGGIPGFFWISLSLGSEEGAQVTKVLRIAVAEPGTAMRAAAATRGAVAALSEDRAAPERAMLNKEAILNREEVGSRCLEEIKVDKLELSKRLWVLLIRGEARQWQTIDRFRWRGTTSVRKL